MRWIRGVVFASLVFKVVALGCWWWGALGLTVGEATAAGEAPAGGTSGIPAELLSKSRGFRELLEATRQRGLELERREQAVVAHEAAVKSLEQLLGNEAKRLEGLAGPGETPGAEGPCNPAVTKIYQNMKPEEAAPILDRVDDATVKSVFACMKERQIGPILAVMNRERAVALTKMLAAKPR